MVRTTPNLRLNQLLKSGAIVEKQEYASQLPDQQGGHYITTLIKERIGGTPANYDGSTDITTSERGNYAMGRIVVGRANGWTERDFVSDITGDDYQAAAGEVAEYWDDVDQDTLIATLKGVFGMTGTENKKFVDSHTYESDTFDATTLNNALQKALGDNKSRFSLAIMHSAVATDLENLKLLEYMKYTDSDGIERQLTLATLNGRIVLVDDTMPAEDNEDGTVTYTTYALGNGAIEYTNCGVKTPSEMERDALKNGGETTLISRQRKVFAPYGVSFKTSGILSPTETQLADGSNWELANNKSADTGKLKYYPHKAIAIAQIKTKRGTATTTTE